MFKRDLFLLQTCLPCLGTRFVENHPSFVHLWSQEKQDRAKAVCLISLLAAAIIYSN